MTWALALACAIATVPAAIRGLRIAQREHYLSPEVTRFALRWWLSSPVNVSLFVLALIGTVGTVFDPLWGFLVAAAQLGPVGLTLHGTTSTLAWTGRLRRVAAITTMVMIGVYLVGALTAQPLVVVVPLLALPLVIDFALWVMVPIEKSLGNKWVERAARKLETVGSEVVAITGSYGKTTTKVYTAHLIAGSKRVVASPASFNNQLGLAKAINENLTQGTEVFVAEMGTYGPGEIAELCRWIPPKVAAIVALGPVHLQRFKTLDHIASSKSEILDRADIGVICVDHPILAELAAERAGQMKIIEVSASDVEAPEGVFAANVAVALGICEALGLDMAKVRERIPDLPISEHRQSTTVAAGGFTVVDDTFNSNPAGAMSALNTLERVAAGRTVVITPGMVELGSRQDEENRRFAESAASRVDHLLIVGRTNRATLMAGSANGQASVTVVDSRAEAVEWVRANLGPGDAVLYENDLPDHYP